MRMRMRYADAKRSVLNFFQRPRNVSRAKRDDGTLPIQLTGQYLPEGSPLQGRVPGGFQGIETIGGRRWQLVSIHPYTGNGAACNKDRYGFHTYYDEMLSWLYKAN